MKNILRTTLAAAILLSGCGLASAQPYQDDQRRQEQHRGVQPHEEQRREEQRHQVQRHEEEHYRSVEEHNGWHRGQQMRQEDWERGEHFDYRSHGLREPPRGYEWRQVKGVYILGAITTGLVLDLLLNAR